MLPLHTESLVAVKVSSSAVVLRTRDYARTTLQPRHRAVVGGFAEALFSDGIDDIPEERIEAFVDDINDYVSAASKTLRFGLVVMLDVMRLMPPFVIGKFALFEDLDLDQRTRMLEKMESSHFAPLLLVFIAFKTIMTMAYFEDEKELRSHELPGSRTRALQGAERGMMEVTTPRESGIRAAAIVRGRELTAPVYAKADVVVIGSGAGGAVVARELARAGRSVIVLEEGGHHPPEEYGAMSPSQLVPPPRARSRPRPSRSASGTRRSSACSPASASAVRACSPAACAFAFPTTCSTTWSTISVSRA